MSGFYKSFPTQKKSLAEKTEQWRKDCIDGGLAAVGIYDNDRRSSRTNKLRNYNIYNGKLDPQDIEAYCNSISLSSSGYVSTDSPEAYDIWSPIFNLLFGEEGKRPFNFVVRAVNEDAISQKETDHKQKVLTLFQQILQAQVIPEEGQQVPQTPKEIEKYLNMSDPDMRESIATKILTYLKRSLKLDYIFQKGWEDALLAAEEIYCTEIISNEPIVRRCNPIEIFAKPKHNSDLLDDAEVIVEETWMSVSEIVDNFYEDLTPGEIDELEEGMTSRNTIDEVHFALPDKQVLFASDPILPLNHHQLYDAQGNIRVVRVTWQSRKKVGIFTYIDELGQPQETMVNEDFKLYPETKQYLKQKGIDKPLDWIWINEYWEGWKIGDSIYKNMRPKELQFRRLDNISACKSGYTGTIYNCNNSVSVSLMDRLIPWIYLYLIIWDNTKKAIAKNLGNMAMIDISLIPDGWEPEKFMYYAKEMGFAFVNGYNEGQKGERTGKLNQSPHSKALSLESGAYINNSIQLLDYIKTQTQELSGVTRQRMGAINNSEQVGNTERAVVQSSHITEKWFQIHNWTKQRVLEQLVDTARHCWKGKNKKLQYVTDDLATIYFSVDDEINNAEYGVFVSNAAKDIEALDQMKALAQAALQNDQLKFSNIIDIYTSDSIADVKSKIVKTEQDLLAFQQQAQEQEMAQREREVQAQQQMHAEVLEDAEKERALKQYISDTTNETKIQVAEINVYARQDELDQDGDGIPDPIEIADISLRERELDASRMTDYLTNRVKEKDINKKAELKEREIASKEKIEKLKIEQTKVQNKSQEKIAAEANKLKEKELKAKIAMEKIKLRAAKKKSSN
jgi:hypothetical protein